MADKGPDLFERSDKDGDGFVTKAEFVDGRNARFARIDANGDKILDQAELDKAREDFRQRMGKSAETNGTPPPKPEGKEHRGFMRRMDTDADGKITAAEFTAAGERMFAKLDDNGDGKLVKDEMPRHRKRVQDAPTTGDAPAQ
ncbi:MAG: EF-hand domain-containing protein [Dongiaceae bacterium]